MDAEPLSAGEAEILKLYSPPTVAVLVGHMIDSPTRAVPRFPASVEGKSTEELNAVIKASNIKIGYTSLACGSDIMFAEAVLASGEKSISRSVPPDGFHRDEASLAGERNWVQRFINWPTTIPFTSHPRRIPQ